MGFFSFLFGGKGDDDDDDSEGEDTWIDPQEIEDTLNIIHDPEYDEWDASGQIPRTNPPGSEGDDTEFEPPTDHDPDTEDNLPIVRPWWWPF